MAARTKKRAAAARRDDELALVKSVQEAIAGGKELAAIYVLVGRALRRIFSHVASISVLRYDAADDLVTFGYQWTGRRRLHPDPYKLDGRGFTGRLVATRRSIVVNRDFQAKARKLGAVTIQKKGPVIEGRSGGWTKSAVYVPMRVGGEVKGAFSLQHDREDAFREADVRLLETLAASVGVAIENARLLREAEERNLELAVINSIQDGIAGSLDFQGIVDLVGDKLREVFRSADVMIRWLEPRGDLISFPYICEQGVRIAYPAEAAPRGRRFFDSLLAGETVVARSPAEKAAWDLRPMPGTDSPLSQVIVPITGSAGLLGAINLGSFEREDAFDGAAIRMLETVASAMGVALENARLFDQTQRLFKESEQRAAELAIVNSVQEGLASKLDMDAIYRLVGDKIREIFQADTTYIAYHDQATDEVVWPYFIDRGDVPATLKAGPARRKFGKGLSEEVMRAGQPILLRSAAEQANHQGVDVVSPGHDRDMNESWLGVPIFCGGRTFGLVSVQSYRRDAFGESDMRLLSTLAGSLGAVGSPGTELEFAL